MKNRIQYWPMSCLFTNAVAFLLRIALLFGLLSHIAHAGVGDLESPQHVDYPNYPAAPFTQEQAQADAKSAGCMSCHTRTDQKNMHQNPGIILGCTDCHGGDAAINKPGNVDAEHESYRQAIQQAHVQPTLPETWNYPSAANPEGSFALLNRESPEYIRFINPSDYRVADHACGACHAAIIESARSSLMSTATMFWGGAAYNNGILPFKRYMLGEFYNTEGQAAAIANPVPVDDNMRRKGIVDELHPLPAWETIPPADVFRVFERGGRNVVNLFPETGLPNAIGQQQRLEEPGRPDIRQSNRGPATGNRIAVPVLNIHKTRLNDPFAWFLGTNDNPGDYRSSGCAACHVVYANDRDPAHSGPWAKHGHRGKSATVDPTIDKNESGHPIEHSFTRAIPSAQCMTCHMHQPNIFINSFYGYTMWDYESDAPAMWPKEQRYPTDEEIWETNQRNPEEAAIRGLWGDQEFLAKVSELNPELKDTQFADYHGHGWNFRAIFKRDRKGNLLDAEGEKVSDTDPKKFDKAVHMSSIHMDVGMHCVDCHFAQDNHGNGHLYGEVAQAVEVDCVDCHGTSQRYPSLQTSGPAAPPNGHDLLNLKLQDGRNRFEWIDNKLIQHSALNTGLSWEVSLVKDSVEKGNSHYNAKAARAKLMSNDTAKQDWGPQVAPTDLAHKDEKMMCITCHTSWTTSCGGCHLPIQANWKTNRNRYEGNPSRNFSTYNPQVARDQMFQLGVHGEAKGHRIAPIRSSSALVLSSRNANRELIYIQQPPVSASGFSSQAFAPHFPHTVRKTETKTCTDCHLSEQEDNNAIMAQLLLQGTKFVDFIGYNAWVGTDSNITAVRVTEWDEPQAVLGSYLQKYAYPDWYKAHQDNGKELKEVPNHSTAKEPAYSHRTFNPVNCLQLRGEYLYVAQGSGGMEAYDVSSIANKAFSQRIISAPVSPLGHDTRVASKNATCVVMSTTQPVHPDRNQGELMRVTNQEQAFHPVYNYAFVTDSEEGLILVDTNTMADGKPRNNFLERALTWNENGILNGAKHITLGGYYAYITADIGLVILNLNDPLKPKLEKTIAFVGARASALQFRYLLVTDELGLNVVDVTNPAKAKRLADVLLPLKDAHKMHLARTYAYIAAGEQGLAIVDIEKPGKPKLVQLFTADGQLNDARDVVVGSTNASLFAYVADGKNGLKVVQLTSPDTQPKFYGFSPEPKPELIAWYPTDHPALSLSRGLERDRAVDETGGQMAVFGRIGSRPFTLPEMQKLYMNAEGGLWKVQNE